MGAGLCSLYQKIHYIKIHYIEVWVYLFSRRYLPCICAGPFRGPKRENTIRCVKQAGYGIVMDSIQLLHCVIGLCIQNFTFN